MSPSETIIALLAILAVVRIALDMGGTIDDMAGMRHGCDCPEYVRETAHYRRSEDEHLSTCPQNPVGAIWK